MLPKKTVENVGESADNHKKVDDTLNQGIEASFEDLRVEENTEPQAQNVDEDNEEVFEILVSNSFGSKNQQMVVDEEIQPEHENVGVQDVFDLIVEDFSIDFNGEIFQDAQEESEIIQQDNQTVQEIAA